LGTEAAAGGDAAAAQHGRGTRLSSGGTEGEAEDKSKAVRGRAKG